MDDANNTGDVVPLYITSFFGPRSSFGISLLKRLAYVVRRSLVVLTPRYQDSTCAYQQLPVVYPTTVQRFAPSRFDLSTGRVVCAVMECLLVSLPARCEL